jgi:6,7-dimethyl-8-ribityllumazine synthase
LGRHARLKIKTRARRRSCKNGRRSSRENKKASHGFTRIKTISTQRHRDTEQITEETIRRKTRVGKLDASGLRFGVVVSRFNEFITDRLLRSAYDGLTRSGAKEDDIEIIRVPGSFEIPSAARTLAETKKYNAIICLGCLIRGDTAHYDVIVNEVTRGIGQSAQETGVPHAFGVLTCENLEQAIDRAGLKMGNKGFEAALAAVEMGNLKSAISHQPSAIRKTKLQTAISKRSKR